MEPNVNLDAMRAQHKKDRALIAARLDEMKINNPKEYERLVQAERAMYRSYLYSRQRRNATSTTPVL